MDVQRVKTVLSRQMLDNLYASNLPMSEAEQGAVVNPEMLVAPKFGGVIWRRKGLPGPAVSWQAVPFVADKVLVALQHFDQVIDAHVILTVEKLVQKAEVTLHVSGKDLHCESEEDDLYAAIDLLADKLDRQVLRYKDKLHAKRT